MTNLVNKPEEVVFRQTLNVTWKRWQAPKKQIFNGAWRRIDNVDNLINKKDGIAMALWRLQSIMNKVRDTEDKAIWKTVISKRKRITIRKNTYSVWTLTCTRIRRDMSGVM